MTSSNPGKPRRPYRLTPEGLAKLQANIQKVQPWKKSTGPRTPQGKARSSQNARKHGERSAEAIVNRKLILELKSVERLTNAHKKQLLTYLRLTGMKVGYLLNFGEALIKDGITRIIHGHIS